MFSKTLSLDITKACNLLISQNISKFHRWKAKAASKTQQLILIKTEINAHLNSWIKFLLNNSQPSKGLKFNRQTSQLEKKNNRQSSKLPPRWERQKPLEIRKCIKYVLVEQLLPVNPAGHDWFASETINSTDVIEKPRTSQWRCLWQQNTNKSHFM